MLLQRLHESSHRGGFLADGHIDTVDRLAGIVEALLVDDGIDGDGGLARLAVSDDELTLSAPDGNHRVDSLQTCLQRLLHRLAVDDARGLTVERHLERVLQVYLTLAVDGLSERIDDAAQHIVVHTDTGDAAGALHHHTLFDARRRAQQHAAHIVLLEVHHDGHRAVFKLQQLAGLGIAQTVDTGSAVADGKHGAHLIELLCIADALQLVEQHLTDFAWFDFI